MSDFLVNTKTGRYDLRSDLVLQYGRKELFHLIANGTFIDEDKWIERKKNSSEIIEDRLERKNQAHAKCKTAFIVMKDGRYVVGLTETQIGAVTIKETLERRHPSSEYKILGQMTILSDEFIAIEYEPTQIEKDLTTFYCCKGIAND